MKALIALICLALAVWYLITVNSSHAPMPGLPEAAVSTDGPRPLSPDVYEQSSATGHGMRFFVKDAVAGETQAKNDKAAVRSLGIESAPVTMYVFTSLTCYHCADYHTRILPQIIKKYVNKNRVRLIYVDFPLDSKSMLGAILAHCLKPAQYLPFIDQLFAERDKWINQPKVQDVLATYAQQKGLTLQQTRMCMADKGLQQSINQTQQFYATTYQVDATPTTVLESKKGQKKVVGADLETIEQEIRSLL